MCNAVILFLSTKAGSCRQHHLAQPPELAVFFDRWLQCQGRMAGDSLLPQ